ncbi:hypothetical protein [Deinococcus ficus]|uniref:hypothetical protein n=1 Tax=Deinococcus ficus TaxID=317577 RepID=UPI0003B63AA6|nr:hypothetical protein [Deinococcus ficus]
MSKPPRKGLMDSLVNVAKASTEELLDRGRAVAHDVAARTGTDEAANERSRLAAAEARARADVRRGEYEADMTDLSQSIERGVEGGLSKAVVRSAPGRVPGAAGGRRPGADSRRGRRAGPLSPDLLPCALPVPGEVFSCRAGRECVHFPS